MTFDNWTDVRLGDLIEVKHGWPFKSEFFSSELTGRPVVVAIGNFRYTGGFRFDSTETKEYLGQYPREFELKAGDILVVMTCQTSGGEILGVPARIPDDGRCYLHNQRMGKILIKKPESIDNKFLYYLFLWKDLNEELVASYTGTKIVHTAPSRIEAFRFLLPSRPLQEAIGAILSALDKKIELNRRMNETLDKLATTLFVSWFVDFDPVQAKRDGREPLGTPQSTIELFPEHFADSELGPIPRGWKVQPLDTIAEFLNGLALQNFPPEAGLDLPVIKIAQLRAGHSMGAERASADIPPEYVIDDGDVIFSWSGSLLADVWSGGRGALNQHLFKVTSRKFPKWFFLQWTKEHLPEFQNIAADKATTMGHIRRHHLADAKVVVPGGTLLRSLSQVQEPLLERVIANRIENRTLAAVRDTLLPALLSGGVTIKAAEKALSRVA
jgi:type I restriction enzyme S subunit